MIVDILLGAVMVTMAVLGGIFSVPALPKHKTLGIIAFVALGVSAVVLLVAQERQTQRDKDEMRSQLQRSLLDEEYMKGQLNTLSQLQTQANLLQGQSNQFTATGAQAIANAIAHVKLGPPPARSLSPSVQSAFTRKLLAFKHPEKIDIITHTGDQEAINFAAQWRQVFANAKWLAYVSVNDPAEYDYPIYGLVLYGRKDDKAIPVIRDAMREAGFDPTITYDDANGTMFPLLVVGSRQ